MHQQNLSIYVAAGSYPAPEGRGVYAHIDKIGAWERMPLAAGDLELPRHLLKLAARYKSDCMFYSNMENRTFLIRLEKGEPINSSIRKLCEKLGIKNAYFSGIGSVENPTLAHYRVDSKRYKEKEMDGIFEVTGLVGNVAVFEGNPLVHSHINISDDEMRAIGGHLVEGTVSATLEIVLQDLGGERTKKHSEEIGLKLFELGESL